MHKFDAEYSTDTSAALEAGQALADAEQTYQIVSAGTDGATPFILHNGSPVSLENMLPKPLRQRASIKFDDSQSFIEYVNLFKLAGTLIFAQCDLRGGAFTAKIDYPKPGDTSWNEHTARLVLVTTPDWQTWTAVSGKWMDQETFCLFVEKNRAVFATPTAADMLEISRNIEAKKEGEFKSGMRLSNGDRELRWESTTKATAGVDKLPIPEEINVSLIPFEGGSPMIVRTFLRFRIESGHIKFMVELDHPEEIIRFAVQAERTNIGDATLLPVLNGAV
jgi:uncharacterized protein YfdQ (DUF2303 family)